MLQMVIIFLLWLISICEAQTKTHYTIPIDNNPGIYFERIKDIRYTQTDWKILVYIDTNPIHFDAAGMYSTIYQVNQTCTNSIRCRFIFKRLEFIWARIHKVRETHEILIDIMKEVEGQDPTDSIIKTVPKRSAPLSFIGNLERLIFGTLSEEDADHYNQEIDKLSKSQVDLAKLGREEAHLVRHKMATIEKEIAIIKESVNTTLTQIQNYTKEYTDITNWWTYNSLMS